MSDGELEDAGYMIMSSNPQPVAPAGAAGRAKPRSSGKARAKPKKKPKPSAAPPQPADAATARPSHMLSVFELCNNSEDEKDADTESATTAGEMDMDADTAMETPAPSGEEDNDEGDAPTVDEGWSDHNRWYCNICKDGGELLCCDRCPRAFHMSCLGMGDDAIPDSEWYCKMCSECLDRRRVKKESKEKARVMRETAKLERDARKLKAKQLKEELLAKKSAEALEHKAKRVLEMQDRILSRKKVKYKDKEEEKLGRIAEDLAQTVRTAKEKLEKLEKEDAALRKKEEALNKKKRGLDDIPPEVMEDDSQPDKPTPMPCCFGEIPSKYSGKVLALWDCLYSFRDVLQLSPMSVDQFGRALSYPQHSPMLTEIHLCLLELILEDREDEDYVSDDEDAMDDSERYRYEIQHAPLTVGVPTLSMLNSLSWPSILCNLIAAVPRYTTKASSSFLNAFKALQDTDYPSLAVGHKLSLLQFLVSRVFGTEKARQMLGKHLGDTIQSTKEYNRGVMQDRKLMLEDEKKMRERQRAELTSIVDSNKTAMKTWLKGDKKSGANYGGETSSVDNDHEESKSDAGTASESDLDELAHSEEALAKNEEELDKLQQQEYISRHEYLSRKKKLDRQRERLRQKTDEKLRKQKALEQMERKRAAAKKGITDGLASKDPAVLRSAIDKGKECGLPDRIIVSATHVLEILDVEAVREEEAAAKKRAFHDHLRECFVRTEPMGRDRDQLRYWMLQGDTQRLYVERPGPAEKLKRKYEALAKSGSPRVGLETDDESDDGCSATWYCYSSKTEINSLMEALDARVPREAQLRTALTDNMEELTKEMPVSKPGFLISDLLNDDGGHGKKRGRSHTAATANGAATDFLEWQNEKHATRRKAQHAVPNTEAFRQELMQAEQWISKCLRDYGSNWHERSENGQAAWIKSVQATKTVEDFAAPLLALESEVLSFQVQTQRGAAAPVNSTAMSDVGKNANVANEEEKAEDKSDAEDEEEDEEMVDALADDGTLLWPSRHCRERWLQSVKRGKTVSIMATALASLVHRLEVLGFSNASVEDTTVMTTRAKSEKEKRSRKERAAQKKQSKEEAMAKEDARLHESVDEWEEDCYICTEGGELLCCDGCPHVFHYTCIGLRRIPRGKIFCHACDASVKPVFPVHSRTRSKDTKAAAKRPQRSRSPSRTRKHAKLANSEASEASDSDDASSVASSSAATKSLQSSPRRPAHVERHVSGGIRNPEDQWDVDCSVCGLGGELLCCDGCPRAFHVACIGLERIPDTEWFCNECNLQTCGACKKNKIRLDSHVICGSEDGTKGCERVFHLKCAKLSAVPEDDWYCKKCRAKL